MGITGLLPLLKSVQQPVHLSELSGKVIAVDAYVWLHRGVCSCATELATGEATTKYVEYAMQRARLLQHYNITPFLVFDGGPLPAKKATEAKRYSKRKESLELANSLAKQGKHRVAREHYLKAVDVTPQMAFQLIKALRSHGISYVVAPYEADAQLVYLESLGLVDGILTEDSDLLIFGAKSLYLKLDTTSSSCILIRSDTLASNANSDFPLHGWTLKELRQCAMLNGCDYLEGIPGVGLKTASRYLRRWRTLEKTLRALRMDGKLVDKDWVAKMSVAEVGFLHQRVWDPLDNKIVYLTEPDPETWNAEREIFVGKYIESDLASRIARGDIDPTTLTPMIDILPSYRPCSKDTPLRVLDCNRPQSRNVAAQASILQFFQKQTTTPKQGTHPVHKLPPPRSSAGKTSGKRTLIEEYERETSVKRCKLGLSQSADRNRRSKFFGNTPCLSRSEILATSHNKENSEEPFVYGIRNQDHISWDENVDLVESENYPFIHNNDLERNGISELSSPLQRIAVPPCSVSVRSQKNVVTMSLEEDILEDFARSPSSSDGRITSPPSGSKNSNSTGKKSRQTGVVTDENHDVFTVDLKDSFSREATPVQSPARREYLDAIADDDDEIEDDFQTRHRLVAEGWEKRFSRYAYVHSNKPCQPLQRTRTL